MPRSVPHSLPAGTRRLRLCAIAAGLASVALLLAWTRGLVGAHALSPAGLIDTFERVNSPHSGFRRNHAKGMAVSGYFESNGAGLSLSSATVFRPGRVPVEGRMSLAGGMPYASDNVGAVRSMALRFELPSGEEWRTGMNSLPVFPVNSVAGFADQLLATAPDPATGKPVPAKVEAFFARHPEAAAARKLIATRRISTGFENTTYNSLNSFRFTNAAGQIQFVRWAMVPVQPFTPAIPAHAISENQLFTSFATALHRQPLQWRLVITVAEPGDHTSDPSLPWPETRRSVEVGILTLDKVQSEDESPIRDLNFDPLVLPQGISASDDPLLSARSSAYSRSFTRRAGEEKKPAAVSAHELVP